MSANDAGADTDVDADAGADTDAGADANAESEAPFERANEQPAPYVESPIIMTTVRVVTPFVFTFGLFVMFHGADSPGGGFQGGVIVGTVVLLLGLAFGIETTREWIGPEPPVVVIGLGVLVFVGIGTGSVLLGGGFLEYEAYGIPHASTYGIELVELAIGAVVAGIVTGMFFAISAGGAPGGEPE